LRFHRQSTGRSLVDFGNLFDSVLSLYAGRITAQQVTVYKRYHQKQPFWGLAGDLRQVLVNLSGNALDALDDQRTLHLRVAELGVSEDAPLGEIRITVADPGRGMTPETLSKLFEPFYTTKQDTGTGLGLWVSQGILEKHNGRIRVRSRQAPGSSGSIFAVYLPRDLEEAGAGS